MLPGARLLVVGAGLIGAEAASTALGLGCEVTLVDPVAAPLAHTVGSDVATWLHGLHTERGISVVTAGVESFADTAAGVEVRISGEDESRTFDAVLLGVGMTPETSLAEEAGLETDQGVVVDAGQTTKTPAVLAVGDSTRRRIDGALLPRAEHWEAAQHDGARAAATILGVPGPAPTSSWFWSDRHGLHLEAVGKIAGAGTTVVRGAIGDPSFSVFGVTGGRVVGAVAVDDAERGACRPPPHRPLDRGRSSPSRRSQRRPAQAAPRLIPNGRAARRHTTYRQLRRRDRMVTVSHHYGPGLGDERPRTRGACGLADPL